jgi:hypothetical protein
MSLVVKTRDEWRQFWTENYANRNPDADVGPNSLPWTRACVNADVLAMMSNNALVMAGGIPLDSLVGDQLDLRYGSRLPRNVSSRSSGYITLESGLSGSTIPTNQRLVFPATQNLYEYVGSATAFSNGQQIAIRSVDPGIGQDLDAGSVLQWITPPAGCLPSAKVFEQPNGKGLYGGRSQESDEEYRNRIRAFNANPVGHGNEGDLLVLLEESSPNTALSRPGHGVPVEKGFVYPAIRGPGTIGVAFTVKRDNYWESRVPTSGEMTVVLVYVSAYMPASDVIFMAAVTEQPVNVNLSVTLDTRVAQWTDTAPWPPYLAPSAGSYVISSATSPTAFVVARDTGSYSGAVSPSTGTTIGIYDQAAGVFRRKKILTVGGGGPWTLVCDQALAQSDITYTPVSGQVVVPWFDGINQVAESVGKAFSKRAPGEMTAWDPQDGKRMLRIPRPTATEWPENISARLAYDVTNETQSVADATFLYASSTAPMVGDETEVNMLTLLYLGIYKA